VGHRFFFYFRIFASLARVLTSWKDERKGRREKREGRQRTLGDTAYTRCEVMAMCLEAKITVFVSEQPAWMLRMS
jgi:uncharacterized protein YjiS (DUF1127 family)